MDVVYGHNDKWPANTWLALWIEVYNRTPVLPQEIQPWLENLGLRTLNPEQGILGVFGSTLIEYNEEQEFGRSMILVLDPSGKMTKGILLNALGEAPWTPTEAGPHKPSVSYWPTLSAATRESQDAIQSVWRTQQGGGEVVDTVKLLGTAVKVGIFGALGVLLYSLYLRTSSTPAPTKKKGKAK